MIKNKFIIFLFNFLLLFSSCNDISDKEIYNFVGDSLIAGWPLDETFPSQIVYNYGLSGAGIKYLERYRNAFPQQNVVILIGTNDNFVFSTEEEDNYIQNYLATINALTEKSIYLISILPRSYKNDHKDINLKIERFNNKIKKSLQYYPNIIYIDVFNNFIYNGNINEQYYYDGLHLNIFGYELLSSKILEVIL